MTKNPSNTPSNGPSCEGVREALRDLLMLFPKGEHGGETKRAIYRAEAALSQPPTTPGVGVKGDGDFVAGPVWAEPEAGEDGETIYTAEVQAAGGYSVIATVHGATEAEVIARRDRILTALKTPIQGGEGHG